MSFYQPGTFGNIQLFNFLNQNFGVKPNPTIRAMLTNQINPTAAFQYRPPQAATAAIGRRTKVGCCDSCTKGSK